MIEYNSQKELLSLLEKGYSKSELAKNLNISRSTLIKILNDSSFIPSKTIKNRIKLNADWLNTTHGHEVLEALILMYFQQKNVDYCMNRAVEITEQATGFKIGYHGITFGGPVGFMITRSYGTAPITESEFVDNSRFSGLGFGSTVTFSMGTVGRYTGSHEKAFEFNEKHKNSRIYLKLFKNYSFSSAKDLESIKKLILSKYSDSIFLLEAGLLAGSYDYFFLVIAKDEMSYLEFLTGTSALYSVTANALTDSKTLCISPQGVRPIFTPDYYSLSSPSKSKKRLY